MADSLGAGLATITITDTLGCITTQTVVIATTAPPTANASASVTINFGSSTILSAGGGGTYQWIPSTALSCDTCQSPTADPTQTTNYCVVVTDNNGCTDTACVTVVVNEIDCSPGEFFVPNAFSPNDDGQNDVLKVYYENIMCIKTYRFEIFNRWGENVFETNLPDQYWDGVYNGKLFNTDVFVYYLQVMFSTGDEIIKEGNISLIR